MTALSFYLPHLKLFIIFSGTNIQLTNQYQQADNISPYIAYLILKTEIKNGFCPKELILGTKAISFCGTTQIGKNAHSFCVLHTHPIDNGQGSRQPLLPINRFPAALASPFKLTDITELTPNAGSL